MLKTLGSSGHIALVDTLKDARQSTAVTQDELASALGRPQSYIAKIEGGQRRLDVVEFVAIVSALKADGEAILRELMLIEKTFGK